MNAIYTRRSVRSFLDQEVEAEKVEKLIRAAMQAPSAWGQAAAEYIVIQNREVLGELAKFSPYSGSLTKAPVGIIVLGNLDKMKMPEYIQQDLGAATQNILLEAVELELGGVWYGTMPEEEYMDYVKNMFELPDNLVPYSIVAVGYPKKENANTFVDRFDESKITYIK